MLLFGVIQKNLAILELIASMAHLGNLVIDIRYTGILAKHALSNVSLAPYDISLPFHP
jgi:hypothetical protein